MTVMEEKTYDKRDRAVSAARKVLGDDASEGEEFELKRLESNKRWYWSPLKAAEQLKVGDRVYLVGLSHLFGKITVVGPSACEVKWDQEGKRGIVSNELTKYLRVAKDEDDIPEFLAVKNRQPLAPEQKARLKENKNKALPLTGEANSKRDHRLPANVEPAGLEILKAQENGSKKAKPNKKDKKAEAKATRADQPKGPVKVPKEGSRKYTVFTEFRDNGEEAAIKTAVKLGLSPGSAKSWIGKWKKRKIDQ